MRTVTFQSVLWGVATRRGLDPSVNLLTDAAAALTEYINEDLRLRWEKYEWPELCRLEERYFRADWAVGTAYAVGDEVWDGTMEEYYVCVKAGTGHAVTDGEYWEALTEFDRYVGWEQAGETALGDVMGVWEENPLTASAPGRLKFLLDADGVHVSASTSTVWIRHRLRPSVFTSTVWSASTTYAVGDLVYVAAAGECYVSIQGGSNKSPSSNADYWTKVNFPYVLAPAVKLGAYAASLDEDGQSDKAKVMRGLADDRMMDEFDKLSAQQEQDVYYRVII